MATGKMPRSFWSYTAGKRDSKVEEREAARERRRQRLKNALPSLLVLGGVVLALLILFLT